jgi:hypothetical protein
MACRVARSEKTSPTAAEAKMEERRGEGGMLNPPRRDVFGKLEIGSTQKRPSRHHRGQVD